MFTGIITHTGKVKELTKNTLTIEAPEDIVSKLTEGASISVDGICLSALDLTKNSFSIDFMPETGRRTNIGWMEEGTIVNLELPSTPQTMLAGHIVQGHVDTRGEILEIKPEGNSTKFKVGVPKDIAAYLVEKGSIALNGISLTIIEAKEDYFTVGIIPHTWEATNISILKHRDPVNIEIDVIAKYIKKFLNQND